MAPVGAGAAAPDPQTSNVPYLAWRGEQIRFVKCDPAIQPGQNVQLFLENWSGNDPARSQPQVEDGTVGIVPGRTEGEYCARGDMVSLQDGIGQIKLVVSDSGDPVLKHQFLAAWMTIQTPTLTRISSTSPTWHRDAAGHDMNGDPNGTGDLFAGGLAGRLQAMVKGTFPMQGDYAGLGLGDHVTLPDDWAKLAGAMARQAETSGDPAMRWDIHDDMAATEGHVVGACNQPPPNPAIDAVDNCLGGSGAFSRVFGDLTSGGTIGPFDPLRPDETLLSDGKLDAGDAPMPAARLDVTIAKNTGGSTDISGAGSLAGADKSEVYSRDGTGSARAHNLYAPFYSQYIPATTAGPTSSGIDGPARGNDFTGFLVNGQYDNWDTAFALSSLQPQQTRCLFRNDVRPPNRWTPYGDQSIVVYTDEHGEAQVEVNPGTGFFFDNLGAIMNDNGGCDLQGINRLGYADITATARYPYQQPITASDKASTAVRETFLSRFDKSLSYWPKGAGAENANARIVVAHAQDITGAPFAGETVCFMGDHNAEGMRVFTGTTGPADHRFTVNGRGVEDPADGLNRTCASTDANGNAAVEVFNSNGGTVNVIAEYWNEGLLRHIFVDFGTSGSSGGTPPVSSGGTSGSNGSSATVTQTPNTNAGTAAPTSGEIAKAGLTSVVAASSSSQKVAATTAKTRVVLARILHQPRHSRQLEVGIYSPKSKSVLVRILFKDAKGRTLKAYTRRVKTNRLTLVPHVRIPRHTSRVKVLLVRG